MVTSRRVGACVLTSQVTRKGGWKSMRVER